ncbi:signal peptidase I [Alkalihalobacillus alcalophilus ATCC 27647 = CGMCC 1.3604]|uniref:Signal peptidase I n=1 Tax=Alkalihalobacillus alcalophilus ATCC 27647 = CGMCC 1.3604 TaxID=1218173 RepID=A0A094WJJ3_ALKAL|nr:signal peptidase I [Alkalihalobacillus alcalophilus]KGA96118.1 signal peptidase I [Alkalihalobacillus alcalophilus ATCC 27647 = CGMCC 1.3604]MED1563395.1 signal peptidase I [Alkalihalobacillus alcalophilus]THG90604.1 signal peptidase I [Alkalihalobacillus alcalophilus ATCC 27647 = CGMCC 1.3604]
MEKENSGSWEWLKAILIALALAFLIRYFLFAPIVVDGESMTPTLQDGDRMIVNKFSYRLFEPERFDIVVFHAPGGKDYIKRIIGLPGDEIEYSSDVLYVNGEPVDEVFLEELKGRYEGERLTNNFTLEDVTNQFVVPEDHLFVLGDNRRHSKDSRDIGTVPYEEVIGKASIIFWPLSEVRIAK